MSIWYIEFDISKNNNIQTINMQCYSLQYVFLKA